jgi:hypothetical protein
MQQRCGILFKVGGEKSYRKTRLCMEKRERMKERKVERKKEERKRILRLN